MNLSPGILLLSLCLSNGAWASDPDLSSPVTPQAAPRAQGGSTGNLSQPGAQTGAPAKPGSPSTSSSRGKKFPWQDSKFEDCGQTCLYDKATENMSLQALQLVYTLDAAKQAKTQAALEKVIGNFCLPQDDRDSCRNRFMFVGLQSLRKMGFSIGKNGEAAALLSNRKNVPGKGPVGDKISPLFERIKEPNEPDKKGQLPYVATLDDLQKDYERTRTMVTSAYSKWLDSIPREPSPDEYIKFKEIARDPSNPAAGKFMVPELDANGKPKIDPQYEVAKQKYVAAYAVFQKEFEEMKKSAPLPGGLPPKLDDALTLQQKEIFLHARKVIIDQMNDAKPVVAKPTLGSAPPARIPATGKEQIKGWNGEVKSSKPGSSDSFYFSPEGIQDAIKDLEQP